LSEYIDYIFFSAILLGAIFVGFSIGRWWAVVFVLLVPLAFPLYGPDSDVLLAGSIRRSSSVRRCCFR